MKGFCWLILIIFLLILPIGISIKTIPDIILKDQNTYHINISGSQFWLAIKANFSENTTISFYKYERYSVNGSNLSCFFELLQSDTESYLYTIATWAPETSPDYYFQYHLGPFNRSYYHYVKNITGWGSSSGTIYTCNTSGTYYYIIAALTTNYFADIMINYTGNATFSSTNGTEVFAFGRHDFSGNINVGGKRGTFIVNGKKEITVKNQLFASFFTQSHSTGYEFLRYHTPDDGKEWSFCLEKKGELLIANQSSNFQKGLWWSKNGTYSFIVDMNLFGITKITPDVYLVGADILLP